LIGYAVAGDTAPARGGVYVEAVVGTPRYLNPLLAEPGSPDDDVCALVFSGLTRLGPDGKLAADLATDWSVSADGLRYSFRLRRDAKWHDGRLFAAEDVVATVRALQAPDFPGDPALAALWKAVRVEPTDDGVRFTLPAPDSAFPEQASLGLLPAQVIGSLRGRALLESDFNLKPTGTGPFRVVAAELRRIELTAVEDHWDQRPFVPNVELRFVGTPHAALELLRRGEVVAVRPLPARDASALPSGAVAHVRPQLAATLTLVFNTRTAPLDDPAVRAALARSLDRGRLAEVGGESVVPVAAAPADPRASREALERAGWKPNADGLMQKGDRPLRFVLATSDRPERLALAEELARQLNAAGARVEVQKAGWSGFVADVLVPAKFGAALVETFEPAASPDPARLWGRGAPLNVGGWSSQRAEELLGAARRATTPGARTSALREWQAVFDAEAPGVRLLHPALSYPVAVELKGQRLPPMVLPRDRFTGYADWFLFTRRAPGRF
jgi:peptide/nickel transport system substrate-binding protein